MNNEGSNMVSDESPWEDDTYFSKSNNTNKSALEYISIVTDYLSFPLIIGAIATDIFLIVIILRYKRLKTRTNYFLIHFATSHIMYTISCPLVYYVIIDLFYDGYMEGRWNCVLIRVENFAMALVFTFIGGFGIDSFLGTVKPSWFSIYKQRYLYVFLFFYFGHFIIYFIAACICIKNGFNNNFNFYFLSAYFFAVLVAILYITYKEQNREANLKLSTPYKAYALTISVIVLVMWSPLIIFYNLSIIFENLKTVEHTLWYIIFLPEYLAYCCSPVVVWKLWKSDKQFKTAFRKAFRRKVEDVDYAELNVSENVETVSEPL